MSALGSQGLSRHQMIVGGIDMSISGGKINAGVSLPFNYVNKRVDISIPYGYVNYGTFVAALQNPNDVEQYLFMETSPTAEMTDFSQQYYFSSRSGVVNPANIVGIALDSPTDGYVKVQTTPKVLPDIAAGLAAGQSYIAGANGALSLYAGTGTPIGMAVNSTDFYFGGTTAIN